MLEMLESCCVLDCAIGATLGAWRVGLTALSGRTKLTDLLDFFTVFEASTGATAADGAAATIFFLPVVGLSEI